MAQIAIDEPYQRTRIEQESIHKHMRESVESTVSLSGLGSGTKPTAVLPQPSDSLISNQPKHYSKYEVPQKLSTPMQQEPLPNQPNPSLLLVHQKSTSNTIREQKTPSNIKINVTKAETNL